MASPEAVSPSVINIFGHEIAYNNWTLCFAILSVLVAYDQGIGLGFFSSLLTITVICSNDFVVTYQLRKKHLPGPAFKIPFMGSFLDSMRPTFEKYYIKWQTGPLSVVSVFHKFIVIVSERDLSRKVLNSPSYVSPCVVDAGKKILKHTNWVFLDGHHHMEYRKGLNGLFTRKALGIYLPVQERVYYTYFKKFLNLTKNNFIQFMVHFRDINIAISCRTFCGDYISDDAITEIADLYWSITAALELVNFPLALPFTKIWYGIRARNVVLKFFMQAAAQSRKNMEAGKPIVCMMDEWISEMIATRKYQETGNEEDKPTVPIRMFSDEEISLTFISFLFASQDATSSAVTWLFQMLADNPKIFSKVREEQLRIRDGNINVPLSNELIDQMTYTRAVVKECLRIRPPVLMVPYKANKDFPITPEYTIPKDSMVIPTLYCSLNDPKVYPEPHKFTPERWIEGNAEENPKNWLVFGYGPHVCIGQQYVLMHLIACIGKAAMLMDWEHKCTSESDTQMIFATTFPQDRCWLKFTARPECKDYFAQA